MRPGNAVWTALHNVQPSSFYEFGRALSRRCKGNNAIIVAMNHKRWHIDTGQILTKVLVPGWDAGQAGRRR